MRASCFDETGIEYIAPAEYIPACVYTYVCATNIVDKTRLNARQGGRRLSLSKLRSNSDDVKKKSFTFDESECDLREMHCFTLLRYVIFAIKHRIRGT